jgi:hypothetical protein
MSDLNTTRDIHSKVVISQLINSSFQRLEHPTASTIWVSQIVIPNKFNCRDNKNISMGDK